MVEIVKALAVDCRVVIGDEPTTTLTLEDERLLMLLGTKKQNVTIIYISHRLDEVFQIADRYHPPRWASCRRRGSTGYR
jgi:ABC-type sugar transport system ATPase subunit